MNKLAVLKQSVHTISSKAAPWIHKFHLFHIERLLQGALLRLIGRWLVHTFAIHRTSVNCKPCWHLVCIELYKEMKCLHHIDNSAFSVCSFCMSFVSFRYYFIVFNASVLYFQTTRPLLRPGQCLYLVPSLRQVIQSLEEVADQDHSWRAELMMQVTLQYSLSCLSWISPVLIMSSLTLESWGWCTELINFCPQIPRSLVNMLHYSSLCNGESVLM